MFENYITNIDLNMIRNSLPIHDRDCYFTVILQVKWRMHKNTVCSLLTDRTSCIIQTNKKPPQNYKLSWYWSRCENIPYYPNEMNLLNSKDIHNVSDLIIIL